MGAKLGAHERSSTIESALSRFGCITDRQAGLNVRFIRLFAT
jgi:hypothetical protein